MKWPVALALMITLIAVGVASAAPAARVETIGAPPDDIAVLYIYGSPYQMGYDHGRLLGDRIKVMYPRFLEPFIAEAAKRYGLDREAALAQLDEVFEQCRPFIPDNIMEEMRGLAEGAGIPLEQVHRVHVIPVIAEGDWCSAFAAWGPAVGGGHMIQTRILDWSMDTGCQDHPLITVYHPDQGNAFVNVGWCGSIGCVTGMNVARLAMSEMTAGNLAAKLGQKETPQGLPMPFLMREVLRTCSSLAEGLSYIRNATRTASFFYVIGDGDDQSARLLATTPGTVLEFKDNDPSFKATAKALGGQELPAFDGIVYGSHYNDRMAEKLAAKYGDITAEYAYEVIAPYVMMPKSNLHSVVFDLTALQLWAANANGLEPAGSQKHVHFDVAAALAR